jgi:hypothetical protein
MSSPGVHIPSGHTVWFSHVTTPQRFRTDLKLSGAGFKVTGSTDSKVAFHTTLDGPLDHAGLCLVTCGGTFDQQTGHYTSNVIVYARLAQELAYPDRQKSVHAATASAVMRRTSRPCGPGR